MDKEETKPFSFDAVIIITRNSARLFKILWAEKKSLIIIMGVIFLIVSSAPFLQSGTRGLLINELVRIVQGQSVGEKITWLIILLLLANIIPAILYTIQEYLALLFYFFLGEKFELMILKRRGEIDMANLEDPKVNDLMNKINENGVFRIQNFVDRQFYTFQNMAEVIIASIILIYFQWWVFVIIFAGMVPGLIVELRYGKEVWGIHGARAEIRRKFWAIQEHFRHISWLAELKIFQNTGHFLDLAKNLFLTFQKEQKAAEKKKIVGQLISITLSLAVLSFAIVWFILKVIHGELQIGSLTFVLASIYDLRQALSSFFRNIGRQYQDGLFVDDVFKMIDIKPIIKKPTHGEILNKNKTPKIVFENINFTYPGTSIKALKNFSLEINPGEKIALVGANGAGKTTFVKLLCRFYDPTSGRISINGQDLKNTDLDSWYQKMGVISQEFGRYHFPVKEAIAVGQTSEPLSIEKVKDAAEASEADGFIEKWPKNYDQMLGKHFSDGLEPSVGQWQKLALARVFYRHPRILILDEPTSSIDAESEARIFEKLEAMPKDHTAILISHRFSTVRHADKICVIDRGVIKELGTHEELLELNGIYARLFKLQAKGYK